MAQPIAPRLTENFDESLGFTTGADGALYRHVVEQRVRDRCEAQRLTRHVVWLRRGLADGGV